MSEKMIISLWHKSQHNTHSRDRGFYDGPLRLEDDFEDFPAVQYAIMLYLLGICFLGQGRRALQLRHLYCLVLLYPEYDAFITTL